jgi:SAM-dependent methyltransferase
MIAGREARAKCFRNIARVLRPGGLLYATAHLVNGNFMERFELTTGSWYDPVGRFSTVAGEPAYSFSKEDEFREEIEKAGLVVSKMKKVMKEDAEHPFHAGGLWIDARKPDANGV